VALLIFVLSYIFIAGFRLPGLKLGRAGGAFIGAGAMVVAGVIAPREVGQVVDVDTIVLLLGMMVIAAYMTQASLFRAAAWYTLRATKTPRALLAALVFVAGGLSAFLVNDTICLMLTPLVLALVESAELPPTPYLLGLAMASNAGSVATFTGNPQNMLIGVSSGMQYRVYVAYMALPALASLAVVVAVLLVMFRHQLPRRAIHVTGEAPRVDRALLTKCALVGAGVVVAFFAGLSMAWSAFAGAAVLMVLARRDPREALEEVDYVLLVFFACLFVIVAGVHREGWAEHLRTAFAPLTTGSALKESAGFAFLTTVGSNLFSNVPWVMLSRSWVPGMSDPTMGWQVLALASTLAGNLTLVGSVANLIVVESARGKAHVGFWEYLKVGVPVTLLSLALGLGVLVLEHALVP